jgi:hypothetical protein
LIQKSNKVKYHHICKEKSEMADKVNGLLDPTEQEMLSGLLGRMKPEELLRALQNTAQSASNMVVENVSAPVDGLAWLLKKAGVSVGDKPVMGSDWMRDKGLTIPTQEGASKVVGDTIGLLAPMGLTKGGAQAMMEVGGKMKNLPVGLSIKDVSKEYPLAPAGTRYEEFTGDLTYMTPDEYIGRVRPLTLDDVAQENIDDLKNHIQSGRKLDPLHIYADGKEDGRHRAYAAKQLGINKVPVALHDSNVIYKAAKPRKSLLD